MLLALLCFYYPMEISENHRGYRKRPPTRNALTRPPQSPLYSWFHESSKIWKFVVKQVLRSRKLYLRKLCCAICSSKIKFIETLVWLRPTTCFSRPKLQYIIGQKEHHKPLATNHKGIWRPEYNFTKARVSKTN